MKLFSDRCSDKRPFRGYVAACRVCGALVVHAESTGEPLHMHRYSKKCREAAAKRVKAAL